MYYLHRKNKIWSSSFLLMALITFSGYPCSGKTTRAIQIKESLEHHLQDASYQGPLKRVTILSDDLLNLDRAVYDRRFLRVCCPPVYSLRHFVPRESVWKSSKRGFVHCNAKAASPGHGLDYRCDELHQRLSLSDVLCCKRNEASLLHSAIYFFRVPPPPFQNLQLRFT